MLDEHVWPATAKEAGGKKGAAGGGGFSADASMRKTHFADHARMLNELRTQAAAAQGSGARVPSSFVDRVLRDFEKHANQYDSYGERLEAALAGKAAATA